MMEKSKDHPASKEVIAIEVAYAGKTAQALLCLQVNAKTTVKEAIQASGMMKVFPEIHTWNDLEHRLGIFGEKVSFNTTLKSGDRVEIYRSLYQDPKEARRERAVVIAKQARQLRQSRQSQQFASSIRQT